MNFQHFIIFGRATKDAELFESKKKTQFAKFSVAVNEFNKKEKIENASFYDVVIFGNSTKAVLNSVKKGTQVLIEGKPEAEAYLSKENEPKAKISILAESWKVVKPSSGTVEEVVIAK